MKKFQIMPDDYPMIAEWMLLHFSNNWGFTIVVCKFAVREFDPLVILAY